MWPRMVFVPSSRVWVPLHHFIKLYHKTYVGIRHVRPCLEYRSKVLEVVWSQLVAVGQVTVLWDRCFFSQTDYNWGSLHLIFILLQWSDSLQVIRIHTQDHLQKKQFVDVKIWFVGTVLIVATLGGLKAAFLCERWSLQSCVDVNPPPNVF